MAAWIAALFVCFSPLSIQLSQYARFYTLFAFAFWLGVVGIYSLFEQRPGWRGGLPIAAGALLCLVLSFHLQPLTIIGIARLGIWVGLVAAIPKLWRQRDRPRLLWTIVALGVLLLMVGATTALETGIAGQFWQEFRRRPPLHALPRGQRGLIALGLLFLIVSNGAPARTILKPFGIALTADETSADWATAAAALQPWLSQASIILTPEDMHALYYLGDYDIAVNPSRLSEIPSAGRAIAEEFSLDPRTGRPVAGTADSLRLIMACYPDGLFVADFTSYPAPWATSESAAITGLIEREMKPVDIPPKSGVVAFRWDRAEATSPPRECASLPEPRTDHPGSNGG